MPMRVNGNDDAPPGDLVQLARQFAQALIHELRGAQLDGTATEQTKSSGGEKSRLAKERALQLFRSFDSLPDDACVPVEVPALLYGCSRSTVFRRVRDGLIPAPERAGGLSRWRVGKLRDARRAASAVPANMAERRARQARASAAGLKAKQLATETATPVDRPEQQPERGTQPKRSRPVKATPVETA